jgi:hypothetical protein
MRHTKRFGRTNLEVIAMNELDGKRVAMLAADGFEQSELIVPKRRLEKAAKVDNRREECRGQLGRPRSGGR